MIMLDTDVMVDVLHKYPPAVVWLTSLGSEVIGVSGLVAMELLQGCYNREELSQVEAKLRPYRIFWPQQADCDRAYKDYVRSHLSHGLGILDALIAETAIGLGATLATFNTKHYRAITALQVMEADKRGS